MKQAFAKHEGCLIKYPFTHMNAKIGCSIVNVMNPAIFINIQTQFKPNFIVNKHERIIRGVWHSLKRWVLEHKPDTTSSNFIVDLVIGDVLTTSDKNSLQCEVTLYSSVSFNDVLPELEMFLINLVTWLEEREEWTITGKRKSKLIGRKYEKGTLPF